MIGRALRAEAVRARSDRSLPIGVVLAVALGSSVVLSLPEGLGDAPAAARRAAFTAFEPALLINAAIVSALLGAFRWTADLERGILARQLGFVGRIPLLASRAVTAMSAGALLAGLVACSGALVFDSVADTGGPGAGLVAAAAGLGAGAGFWGLSVGAVIGRHIPALFLVPTLLVASMPFAATQPWARWTAPIGAWLLATGRDPSGAAGTGDQGIGILVGAGWLIAAAMVSAVVVMRRDIA